ncbi:cytochrome P450 [Umbelopsis sp. PMI_123]|nr:cytochrome P450 [Umbelopsis sp. PMI_123]
MNTLQALADNANQHLENLSSFYTQHVLPYIKRASSKTYIAAAIAAYFSYQVYKFVHIPRKLRHIPAVPFWPYMRSVLSGEGIDVRARKIIHPVLAKSPNGLYLRPNQGGWSVGVANPAAIKTLFLRTNIFEKDQGLLKFQKSLSLKFIGTESIVVLNGSVWKKHRMIANPAFHRSMPVKLFGRLSEKMMVQFEKEGDGLDNVDIPMFLQRFTLDVIGLAGFGYDFEALDNPDNEKVNTYNDVQDGVRNPLYFFFPILDRQFLWALPKRRGLHKKVDVMNDIFNSIIENKRRTLANMKESMEDAEKDLLTLMLEANEETVDADHRLTNSELRSDLAIFFIAGHDTTSNALSFALYYLAANPHIQEKARKEVIDILGDGDDFIYPTAAQCSEMKYIYMIIKETLRMDGPAQNTSPRECTQDTELAGTLIPKGTIVTADMFVMQTNPAIWNDPESFSPERFASGGENESKAGTGLAWAPFGNGSRQCIGMNFSLAEQKVLLSMLLRRFTWTLPEDSIHKNGLVLNGGLSIVSPKDLHLKFTKRF